MMSENFGLRTVWNLKSPFRSPYEYSIIILSFLNERTSFKLQTRAVATSVDWNEEKMTLMLKSLLFKVWTENVNTCRQQRPGGSGQEHAVCS